jgi:hypothetical protein
MISTFIRGCATAGTVAVVLSAGAGCANLNVKKVPVGERASGTDKEKGFRYYLNRPYLVVKVPILIAEWSQLVRVVPNLKGTRRT